MIVTVIVIEVCAIIIIMYVMIIILSQISIVYEQEQCYKAFLRGLLYLPEVSVPSHNHFFIVLKLNFNDIHFVDYYTL